MVRIVVGVDGSVGAQRALAWAQEYAEAVDGTVEAIQVVSPPMPAVIGEAALYGDVAVRLSEEEVMRVTEHAEGVLNRAIAEAVPKVSARERIERKVMVESGVVEVLLHAAKGADLLVVGSRGLGGFRELLLGSISAACVRHAACPVVVVPPPRD